MAHKAHIFKAVRIVIGHTPSLSIHMVDKIMRFQSMLFSILLIEQSSGGSYNVLVREYTDPYWASSRSQYDKILQAHGANTRKFWLVEVIENDCIVT